MAQPSKSGKGGGSSAPTTTPDTPTLSVEIPMKWCALRARVPGSYTIVSGLVITFPNPLSVIQSLGTADTDNVAIVPMTADLVDGLTEAQPWAVKPVKGRLPHLKLYPERTGNNGELWCEYLAAHPARSARVSLEDWKHRTLTLNSAKKES